MLDNIIFYVIFMSQIILLSHYFPGKIINRVKQVLKSCPASEYPKLYIKSPDYYQLTVSIYWFINKIIFLIGIILIVAIAYWDSSSDEEIENGFIFFYFFLQIFPIMLMEIAGFSYFKQMRKANLQNKRKAELQVRGLFDFVSPTLLSFAVISNIACILFVYYLDQYQFYIGSDTFVTAITLLAMNAFFAVIIRFNISGKKLDPYQATEDRIRQITFAVKSMIWVSIMASIFIMVQTGTQRFDLAYLDASLMSLYFQLLAWLSLGAMLRNVRIEDIDFDVYKKDRPLI